MNSKVFSPYSLTIALLRDNVQSSSIKIYAKKLTVVVRCAIVGNCKILTRNSSIPGTLMHPMSKMHVRNHSSSLTGSSRKLIRLNSCHGRIHLQTSRSIVKAIQIHLTSCNSTFSSLHPWNDIHMDRETHRCMNSTTNITQ